MATSVYEQYNNLTIKEKDYIRDFPHHAFSIKESKEKAFEETKKRFGFNGRNDKSDAFRHCFWSAILSRELGYDNAKRFTNAHESSSKNIPAEKVMDLHNNSIGLVISKTGGKDISLSSRCKSALDSGKLITIK